MLKQKIKLKKFRKKINLLRFNVSKTNEFDFLIITIKNSAIDTKSYMSRVIVENEIKRDIILLHTGIE